MKKILAIIITSIALTSCGNSKMDDCMDRLMDEGMSASEARDACEEAREDSQIRR